MFARIAFLLALFIAAPAVSQIADADRALALEDAFARLRAAPDPAEAQAAEGEIWRLWNIGPSAAATSRLAEASALLRRGALNEAHRRLDMLLVDEPEFMEAWNQRAFAKFLKGELQASLNDIEQVLVREPRHFGALAGRARIEASLGSLEAATLTMGIVGRIHPWMARNSAIPPNPPPPEPGEEL